MEEAQLYPMVSKSIVKISIGVSFHHGYVSDCEAHSADVIASAKNFPMPLENFEVALVFPDGNKYFPRKDNIKIVGNIALIHCNFPGDGINTNLVQALILSTRPLCMSDKVYTYSAYKGYTGVITPGFIIELQEDYFHHNCSATKRSQDGALVINTSGELVGLCYAFERYLISATVRAILRVY
uniref:Uncharacterized protein n=2 Tax=Avena sativa TaxID=4498 RepID=A0ACD5XU04_AVESA